MTLEVQLTNDQEAFVRLAIQNGRFANEQDALKAALLLWEEQERRRMEIILAVEEAEASYVMGTGRILRTKEDCAQFGEEIKQRGRARLAAEQSGE